MCKSDGIWGYDSSFFRLPDSSEASTGDEILYAILLRNAGKAVADIFKKEFNLQVGNMGGHGAER